MRRPQRSLVLQVQESPLQYESLGVSGVSAVKFRRSGENPGRRVHDQRCVKNRRPEAKGAAPGRASSLELQLR
jgi:hypothetical protein